MLRGQPGYLPVLNRSLGVPGVHKPPRIASWRLPGLGGVYDDVAHPERDGRQRIALGFKGKAAGDVCLRLKRALA